MKKRLLNLFLVGLVLLTMEFAWQQGSTPENVLAPMVMVNETLWQLSEESDGGFSRSPDGTFREIVGNEIPTKNGQANFGTEGMPYWELSDGIMVYVNGKYFIMKNVQE